MNFLRICFGSNQKYVKTARHLGKTFPKRNICLVYGGTGVGLVGKIALTL